MIDDSYEIKYQFCNLCDAMHRNINDNFENVSFEIDANGDIQTKIILLKKTAIELGYIDDLMGEFTAKQLGDIVNAPFITTDLNSIPLETIVFARRH